MRRVTLSVIVLTGALLSGVVVWFGAWGYDIVTRLRRAGL